MLLDVYIFPGACVTGWVIMRNNLCIRLDHSDSFKSSHTLACNLVAVSS